MAFKFLNRVRCTTATTGTGTITLGSAAVGYQTPAAAGASNADTFPYVIEDSAAWEIGLGTYTSVGTTVARSLIQSSTGALLNLSGTAVIQCDLQAANLAAVASIINGTAIGLLSGSSIDFASGDVTITHATNSLALAGASSGYSFDAVIKPSANDGAALGVSGTAWSDLFLAAGAVVNFGAGDETITAGTNTLAFAGASSGYSFDAKIAPAADDGAPLGDTTHNFSDLFLAVGGVINWGAGDVTLTHSANTLAFAGATLYTVDALFRPAVNDGAALGISGTAWSDLFLAVGGVIDLGAGDVTITHATNALAFAGGSVGYSFDAAVKPSANDAAALGVSGTAWADLFLASGSVVNFSAADVTITHALNTLAFAGGSLGYTFDAFISPAVTDGAALGSASVMWSDLFLASGGVVNFNSDVLITHSLNTLAWTGATAYTFDDAVRPDANDSAALGVSGTAWSDLFLASGAVINFLAGDVTITHSADTLTFAGAATGYSFDTKIFSAVDNTTALGDTTHNFSDLFLGTGAVINFAAGDVTITHAANTLTFAGATNYVYDAKISPSADNTIPLGDTTHNFSDLFLGTGSVVNFAAGDVTITHAANTLAFAGGTSYTFDAAISEGGVSLATKYQAAGSYALQATTISAAGLATGGGSLAANRTITVTAAVQADQETGTSNTVAVTPGVQKFHPSAAKTWLQVAVAAGVPSILVSYNVTSITDAGVGHVTVTLATDFSSANWTASVAVIAGNACMFQPTQAAGSIELYSYTWAAAALDPGGYHFIGYGDQ